MCVVGPTGKLNITVGAVGDDRSKPGAPAGTHRRPDPVGRPAIRVAAGDQSCRHQSFDCRYRRVDQPTVIAEGKSYRIKGQAAVADKPDQKPEYKQFEVEVTCP